MTDWKSLTLAGIAAFLVGWLAMSNPNPQIVDKCLHNKLFVECVRLASTAGGVADCGDMVRQCSVQTSYMAERPYNSVTPECRAQP